MLIQVDESVVAVAVGIISVNDVEKSVAVTSFFFDVDLNDVHFVVFDVNDRVVFVTNFDSAFIEYQSRVVVWSDVDNGMDVWRAVVWSDVDNGIDVWRVGVWSDVVKDAKWLYSNSVWPDLAKFHHFGKISQVFGNFLMVYLVPGKLGTYFVVKDLRT